MQMLSESPKLGPLKPPAPEPLEEFQEPRPERPMDWRPGQEIVASSRERVVPASPLEKSLKILHHFEGLRQPLDLAVVGEQKI